jgi:uncharacterized protein (TIGR02301 family)
MRLPALLASLIFLAAGPAAAQDRTPEQRQTLTALARVMGESQALRQVCLGAADQHWRTRLTGLIDNEQADEAFAEALTGSFNAGLAASRKGFLDCSPATRAAQYDVAERGRALAERLARVQRRVPGWMPSLPEEAAEEVTADTSPR